MKEKLEQIKKISETLGVPVKEENGTLIVGESVNDANLDLIDFLKIYVKDDNDIVKTADGYSVTVKTIGVQNLMMMLKSLFSDIYDFEVKDQSTLLIKNKDSQPTTEAKVEKDLKSLAERIDNDFVEIEIHEDFIEVFSESSKTLEAVAKLADNIDENLSIEIQRKSVVIK